MDKEKNVSKARKVTGIVLTSVLFVATVVGTGFGYAKTTEMVEGYDTSFNDVVKIQADVDFNKSGKDINDAAKSISDTLEFLGMQNANVSTIGSDRVVITNPISSYRNEESPITNKKKDHFEVMDATHNSSYLHEVSSLGFPLFFDGTLDIRDTEGDAALVENEVSGVSQWTLNSEFGVAEDPDGGATRNIEIGDVDEPQNFFEGARLTHSNGYPVIELQIKKEGSDGDGYINAFKDLNTYLYNNPSQEYVVWFNYNLTYSIIDALDPGALTEGNTLYSYVTSNTNLRPLFLTVGTGSMMSSKFSDVIELKGGFNEQQAHYFVNKINNSNSFSYSNINYSVIINLQTKIMLLVLALILLIMILAVIFAFVYYFGLLGLIASAVLLLITVSMGFVFASAGILLSGLGLIALGVIATFASTVMFTITKSYKFNNEDKFHSINRVASDKYKEVQRILFVPLVSSILLFYGAGLILPLLLTIPLYLIVIGMVLSYAFGMLVLMPIFFITDHVIKFTRTEFDGKWDLVIGINKDYSNNNNKDEKGKPLVGVIISLVALALAIVIGGTLYGVTGSAVNSNVFGTQDYAYVVRTTDDSSKMLLNEQTVLGTDLTYYVGYEQFESAYDSTNDASNLINDAFENNGIKVSKTNVVRYDEFVQQEGEQIVVGSFGYEIYSKDAIDATTATAINSDLNEINQMIIQDGTLEITTSFELTEGLSWNGKESNKIISYTQNISLLKTIFALLLMSLIASFIIIFVGNAGSALAALITTLMESVLIVSPLIILYIPFSVIAMIPVLLLAGLSFRNKIVITRDAMDDEIDTNKWKRAASKQKWTTPIIAGMLLIFELLLFGTYAVWAIIPMLVITIFAPISIYLIQQMVFPFFADKFSTRNINKKKARIEADIEAAKKNEDGIIREEYIEGVNM